MEHDFPFTQTLNTRLIEVFQEAFLRKNTFTCIYSQ